MPGLTPINILGSVKKDVEEMLAIYLPFITTTAVSFETKIPTKEEYWQRVKSVMAEAPWLVCKVNGKVAGFAYAGKHRARHAYRFTRELSAYVHPDYQKRGIATALYTALIEILKLQSYANALAGITLPNDASVAFHESVGFKKLGVYHKVGHKFDKFHDVGWWEMQLQENIDDKTKPLESIIDSLLWDQAITKGLKLIK